MHPALPFVLLFAVLPALAAPLPAQSFDGVVTFRTAMGTSGVDTMVQTTKGQKLRLEGMGKDGSIMIIDGATGQMTVLDRAQRTGMTMSPQQMKQMQELSASFMKAAGQKPATPTPRPAGSDASFTKSSRTETIAGQRCQVYSGSGMAEGKRFDSEMCLADGVGIMFFRMLIDSPMFGGSAQKNDAWTQFQKVVGKNQGILKATSTTAGKATTEMEVLRIERGPVSDTAFQVPKGFQVEDMGAKLREMEAQLGQLKAGPGK